MKLNFELEGLEDIARRLTLLGDKDAIAIMMSALRGGLNVVANQIRKELKSPVEHVRKTVGVTVKRNRKGRITAKVGFRVGKKKDLQAVRSGRNKGGVGISGQNVHWWILGAGLQNPPRKRKTLNNASTGIMRPQQPGVVQNAWGRSQGRAKAAMAKAAAKTLERQARALVKR